MQKSFQQNHIKKLRPLKIIFCLCLCLSISFSALLSVYATEASSQDQKTENQNASSGPETASPSVLLMDADTGTILYAKDENTERPLASVTKVMTLLLIFEALDKGQFSL